MSQISRKQELIIPFHELDSIEPTEVVRSILDIDFARYAAKGITNWGFDIEGTVAPGNSSEPVIPQRFVDHIQAARDARHIETLFLLTNRRTEVNGEKVGDMAYAQQAGDRLGADFVFVRDPDIPGKPNRDMMDRALEEMDLDRNSVGYAGDKLTADIRMANEAELAGSIWVNPRHGPQDLFLDRLVRRTLELRYAKQLELRPRTAGFLGRLMVAGERYMDLRRKVREIDS